MDEDIDELMIEMQTEYREDLAERSDELELAWTAAADAQSWRTGLQQVISAAHKLNGSARVFGFGVISDRAEALENYAELIRSKTDSPEGVRSLESLYKELQRVIAETRGGSDPQVQRSSPGPMI